MNLTNKVGTFEMSDLKTRRFFGGDTYQAQVLKKNLNSVLRVSAFVA